jgi:hypothetical protein
MAASCHPQRSFMLPVCMMAVYHTSPAFYPVFITLSGLPGRRLYGLIESRISTKGQLYCDILGVMLATKSVEHHLSNTKGDSVMNNNISSQAQKPVLNTEVLLKEKQKLQPFGSHFLVKLDEANYKLTCSLSWSFFSDIMTDWYGR